MKIAATARRHEGTKKHQVGYYFSLDPFSFNNSRNSRSARWHRNQWFSKLCPLCKVPDWKLEKYSATRFNRHYGSLLLEKISRKISQNYI